MNSSASVMFAAFDALVCTAMVWNPLTRSRHISGVISKTTILSVSAGRSLEGRRGGLHHEASLVAVAATSQIGMTPTAFEPVPLTS